MKKKIVHEIGHYENQLGIDLNSKNEKSQLIPNGKVIAYSTLKEKQYKEIIDLTLQTTKSF